MVKLLQDKVILITGGAAGIGRATAARCVEQGATVIIADINEAAGFATATDLGIDYKRVDITNEDSVQDLCAYLRQQYGGLNVLIHAAGVLLGAFTPLSDFDLATWQKVLDVNLTGTFLCAKHAAPLMYKDGRSCMILVSSGAAVGSSSSFAYGASKGGMNSMALPLQDRLAKEGIRVNVVMPGNIDTAMKRSVIVADAKQKGVDSNELVAQSALGDPRGLAKVLAWLASDDADYVRGVMTTR